MSVKHMIRTVGLALVAALAVTAVAITSAFAAEPEFKTTGKVTLSSKATKTTTLETGKHGNVKCTSDESSGEVETGRLAKKIVVKFKGCKASTLGASCTTSGAAKEEIITKSLTGKPVYINGVTGKKEERGLDLKPETAGTFAEFTCEALGTGSRLKVENQTAGDENGVIGVIPGADVDVSQTTTVIHFTQSKGVQSPTKYEEPTGTSHSAFLETEGFKVGLGEAFAHETSAEEGEETLTFSANVELT